VLVRKALRVKGDTLEIEGSTFKDIGRVAVVGAGKAGAKMAEGLVQALGSPYIKRHRLEGWVNVPDQEAGRAGPIRLHGARSSHENRPTPKGQEGGERMLALAHSLNPKDLLFCLISGGGSALWPAPVLDVSLVEKQRITDLLLASGATILEMNAVRKHLSRVKGGGLVQATKARIVTLIISDVIGDRLDVIASGPTAPDPTTYADALAVLKKHKLLRHVPDSVRRHLENGAAKRIPETLKKPSPRVTNIVLGTNQFALKAAAQEARKRGYTTIVNEDLQGESRALGTRLATQAKSFRDKAKSPTALISGGETTVALPKNHGKGGRNQEIVLTALAHLGPGNFNNIAILSAGTDGEDGPTDAAGAFIDETIANKADSKEAKKHLDKHDAYPYLDKLNALYKTGPTGTNVMDLRVVLVRPPREGSARRREPARDATPKAPKQPQPRRSPARGPTTRRPTPGAKKTQATKRKATPTRSSR
jgi:hydroxypyruvate reductase/glycerate 2-kinase